MLAKIESVFFDILGGVFIFGLLGFPLWLPLSIFIYNRYKEIEPYEYHELITQSNEIPSLKPEIVKLKENDGYISISEYRHLQEVAKQMQLEDYKSKL